MKPMSEAHFAILRRHMVEVIGIQVELASEELGKAALDTTWALGSQIMADAMEALGMTFTSLPLIWRDPAQVSRRRAGGARAQALAPSFAASKRGMQTKVPSTLPIAIRGSRWTAAAPATVSAATSSKTSAAASASARQ